MCSAGNIMRVYENKLEILNSNLCMQREHAIRIIGIFYNIQYETYNNKRRTPTSCISQYYQIGSRVV